MALTAPRGRLVLAFLTVYLVWGSSYLAIRYAVESLPPVGMAGVRFLVAGVVLFAAARIAGAPMPGAREWRAAAIAGTSLMAANAAVAWSERRIDSGVASLIVAVTPCWIVAADSVSARRRPGVSVLAGLCLGLVGIAVLVGPAGVMGGAHIDKPGALVVLAGTLAWTFGSLYARAGGRPESPFMLSAIQMIGGGLALSIVGATTGEWSGFAISQVTMRSGLAFIYLIALPSIAGYTAYLYLLTNAPPAQASTYAFVNPVVAVALGTLLGGEVLSPRVAVAAIVIVAGVVLIVTGPANASPAPGAAATPGARARTAPAEPT